LAGARLSKKLNFIDEKRTEPLHFSKESYSADVIHSKNKVKTIMQVKQQLEITNGSLVKIVKYRTIFYQYLQYSLLNSTIFYYVLKIVETYVQVFINWGV
jgi:hypothetical protein